ncbi:MAG: hypothetical protein H6R21_2955 [Proteobacteria bacterium]|nr:hypothetical protein [Pseudomonadota bacterium]
MTERVVAWQCIGCGRIEGAQPCIGICQDRKAEFVYAAEYDEVVGKLEQAHHRLDVLIAGLRMIAGTTPHNDGWERSYRAMQDRARRILGTLAALPQAAPAGSNDAQA